AWVRIDGFDRRWNSLMLTDGWDLGEPHWQLSREGELILGVKSSPFSNYFSPPVLGQADLGRWVLLVTVYDADAGHVSHYVDGRRVSREAIRRATPLRIGPAEIGNWTSTSRN